MIGRFIISRNESCHESRPGDDPSHHQRSPPPVFLDSIALTPHTCHSSHSQLFPIKMDYLYTTLLLLALVELYVHVCILSRCFSYAGDTCTVCRFCVPVVYLFCFLPCWPFCCLLKRFYLQLDPDLCLHGDISHRPVTSPITVVSSANFIMCVEVQSKV